MKKKKNEEAEVMNATKLEHESRDVSEQSASHSQDGGSGSHSIRSASEHSNDAIDLSSTSHNDNQTPEPPRDVTEEDHRKSTPPRPLVIQPSVDVTSVRLGVTSPPPPAGLSAMSLSHLNSYLSFNNSRYSARRSLILDAPPTRADVINRTPSPGEKRNYTSSSVRDALYGKRKCARPRIRTK